MRCASGSVPLGGESALFWCGEVSLRETSIASSSVRGNVRVHGSPARSA